MSDEYLKPTEQNADEVVMVGMAVRYLKDIEKHVRTIKNIITIVLVLSIGVVVGCLIFIFGMP